MRRRDFFLQNGQLDAPTARIKWLPGTKDGETWMRFGTFYAVIVFVLLLLGTLGANLPRLGVDNLVKALPIIPLALLFATMNATYEEVVFRAAPLSQLVGVVGSRSPRSLPTSRAKRCLRREASCGHSSAISPWMFLSSCSWQFPRRRPVPSSGLPTERWVRPR
jgi:hypothetical protein